MSLTAEQQQAFDRAMSSPLLSAPIHQSILVLAGEQAGLVTVTQAVQTIIYKLLEDITAICLSTPVTMPNVTDGWRQRFCDDAGDSLYEWDWLNRAVDTIIEINRLTGQRVENDDKATKIKLLNMFFSMMSNLIQYLRMEMVGLSPELLVMTPEERADANRLGQAGAPIF